ncbi:MAG TPA: type I methionyl aminopeptidase [Thermoanaerobaculia bacterium]|nr:type I methionyl aminopeptidase [Thermoanaerobaculia bacterium]
MTIQSEAELKSLQIAGRVAAEALEAMRRAVRPGISTEEIDDVARVVIERHGARSAPALVYNFPKMTCISVNEEVVHGIPGPRVLAPGDVVKLDVTVEKDGFMADTACTVVVEPRASEARRLAGCAKQAFRDALAVARAGELVSRVGRVVEATVRGQGFSIIPQLCGHGIGRTIHEKPQVPNKFDPRSRDRFEDGMVVTIEPIITSGAGTVDTLADGWTVTTRDRCLAAHYEHTMVITRGRPLLLTALPGTSP